MLKSRILSALLIVALISIPQFGYAASKGGISQDLINDLQQSKLQGAEKAMADIVANKKISEIALNRERYISHNSIVNYKIKTGSITNQKSSGRCWMFAGFNVVRPYIIKKYNLKNFEFSENYLFFWDKLEKVNVFLQGMIDLADRPFDDRELELLRESPIGDGGWWAYFTDIIDKYGLVPKEVMPETENSSSSGMMNKLIGYKVKEMGLKLRNLTGEGVPSSDLEKQKREMLTEVYRLLVIYLGPPPDEFTWRYETDDSTGFVTYPEKLTPLKFLKDVVDIDLSEYVAIFDYPGKDYFENYYWRWSRNVYDRDEFVIMNLPIDSLRKYALKSILDSSAVWFACDVGKENYRKDGILALDIYNYESILGTEFNMAKSDLIGMGITTPNHAMTFIGVDTANGEAEKWLVENSWGDADGKGDSGVWYMYNDWFDRYLFGVVINKKYLSDELIDLSRKKAIELPPWDPMYSLRRLNK